MRTRLRTVLDKSGWTVREASDGAQALDCVTQSPPQLILLDLTMPVMDGFTFLHKLRQLPGCSDVLVVVLTARDVTAIERDRLSAADRILNKGTTSMRELTAELRKLKPR
jgi:CheY-like chemotaxis protein